MGELSSDLKNLGYSRTERESPFDEDGELWTKGYELVCDETGYVIRKDNGSSFRGERNSRKRIYRYHNSGAVRMPGGFVSSYDWGHDGERFKY